MNKLIEQVLSPSFHENADAHAPPPWVWSWLGDYAVETLVSSHVHLTLRSGPEATLVTAVVLRAAQHDAAAFQGLVEGVYQSLPTVLRQTEQQRIVRMWNHVPGIGQSMGDDVDRYMVFNAGRYAAMSQWFDGQLAANAPAASCVGHAGEAMVVHALATGAGGEPIENPRQVSAYRYSKRYGPLPPCFARATRTREPRAALLISGTAAITGEESRHLGELQRQFALTIDHLRTLAGTVAVPIGAASDPLSRLSHVRAYVPRAADRADIEAWSHEAFCCDVQILPADLCRADLLVEIEAYMHLEGSNE